MTDNAYPLSYIEGEQSIIGGLMLSNDAIDACSDLRVGMFFDPANAKIYQAIVELIADGKPADVVTVHEALEACGLDDVCGGISYLATVSQNTPSAANIRRYVDIVKDRASERQLLQVGDLVRDLAVERNGRLISDRHAEAVRLLGEIEITAIEGSREKTAAEALHDGIREIDHRLSVPEGELGGLHTGLRELDRMLDGLHKGELIIVGARPSMGKSCIGEMISRVNAKRGYAVRFQSYEMPAKHLMFRSAAAEMEINLEKIRKAKMSREEYDKFAIFVGMSAEWRLVIDEDSPTIDKIAVRCQAQRRKTGLDLLIVDHLHLIPLPGRGNEAKELGDVTSRLKRLARDLDIPVVLLAQLNRANSSGVARPPNLTDLRGSGSIEQDADVVIFPHRPGYYDDQANPGEADLIVSKQRNGPVGKICVGWRGDYVRYQDSVPSDWNPPKRFYAPARDMEEL